MEVLIAACLLAWAAGAQSEQAKLGISPAQRALMKEQVRHEKAIRRISERHDGVPTETAAPHEPAAAGATETPVGLPAAFRAGYRGHSPIARVATPAGQRLGNWTARGVYWAKDTGRSAVGTYRKRRKNIGEADPAPVHIPPKPVHPPMPTSPPTAGTAPARLDKPDAAPEAAVETNKPEPAAVPEPRTPVETPAGDDITPKTEPAHEGVGRMASEVTYESVMDESDELSLMCEDDLAVYERIRARCEREIGRADTLIAQLKSPGVKAWITRCAEQYRVILAQLDELKSNTTAQGEGVVKAKALLMAGQGVYADIAAEMETVEEREFYVSDAIDGEDANAAAETYETQGAPA